MLLFLTAHLQKMMSDKKCTAEKKAEMEEVITQVSDGEKSNQRCCLSLQILLNQQYLIFYSVIVAKDKNLIVGILKYPFLQISDGQLHPAGTV